MIESPTLSVSELATRWDRTPRQILDYAQTLQLPLYFMFEGLAIGINDHWHRANGAWTENQKLDALKTSIVRGEEYIKRSAFGETGEYEHRQSSDEIKELRAKINADKINCARITELLEQRDIDRRKKSYRGIMRAAPQTLFEIASLGETIFPLKAYHPNAPIKSVMLPATLTHDATPIWDGQIMDLEPSESMQMARLTIDSLSALTDEVKAIEKYLKAKESDNKVNSNGKRWTSDKLAELDAFRKTHTASQTANKFGITEQRIRQLLPSKKSKATPFTGLTHRTK